MMDDIETIDGIIGFVRKCLDVLDEDLTRESDRKGPVMSPGARLCPVLNAKAALDRLKDVWTRERNDLEAQALSIGGIIESTRRKNKAIGNAAAMREALYAWLKAYDEFVQKPRHGEWQQHPAGTLIIPPISAANLVGKTKEALAAPPRNCDVGTAEEKVKRFVIFCKRHRLKTPGHVDTCDSQCPCRKGGDLNLCALAWEQMPYEEGDGDGKLRSEDAKGEKDGTHR